MLDVLHMMVNEVNNRGHLSPLLKGVNLGVSLNIEGKEVILAIDNGLLSLSDTVMEENTVFIYGSRTEIEALVSGEMKLREASADKRLEYRGSIRNSLLLESLFLLALSRFEKKDHNFFEIIS